MAPLRTTWAALLFLSLAFVRAQDDDDDDDDDDVTSTVTIEHVESTITLESTVTDFPSSFNGWYLSPFEDTTIPSEIVCPGSEYYATSGDYVHCCLSEYRCIMATSCIGSTQVFAGNRQYDCGSGYSCFQMTVFETFPGGEPRYTDVFCAGLGWEAHTIYRNLPTSSDIATSAATAAKPKGTTSFVTPTATPGNDDDDDDDDDNDDSGPNAGLIAGAVVGPVVGVSLILIALWLFRDKIKALFGGSKSDPEYESAEQQDATAAATAAAAAAAPAPDDVKQGAAAYGYPPPDPRYAATGKHQFEPAELGPTNTDTAYELPVPMSDTRPLSQELPAPVPLSAATANTPTTDTAATGDDEISPLPNQPSPR